MRNSYELASIEKAYTDTEKGIKTLLKLTNKEEFELLRGSLNDLIDSKDEYDKRISEEQKSFRKHKSHMIYEERKADVEHSIPHTNLGMCFNINGEGHKKDHFQNQIAKSAWDLRVGSLNKNLKYLNINAEKYGEFDTYQPCKAPTTALVKWLKNENAKYRVLFRLNGESKYAILTEAPKLYLQRIVLIENQGSNWQITRMFGLKDNGKKIFDLEELNEY